MGTISVEKQHAIRNTDAIKGYLKRRLRRVCRVLQIEVEEDEITILVRLFSPRRQRRHLRFFQEIMDSSLEDIGHCHWAIKEVISDSSQKHSNRRTVPLTSN